MRFNLFSKGNKKIKNHQGANAYRVSPEVELYTSVVTSGLSNTSYEGADDRIKRIQKLIDKTNPAFVAKLAIYARTEMNLRSVPLVLAVELAKRNSGNSIVSKTIEKVVLRADEITELLAYYQTANNRQSVKKLNRLSKQVQKGLAKSHRNS